MPNIRIQDPQTGKIYEAPEGTPYDTARYMRLQSTAPEEAAVTDPTAPAFDLLKNIARYGGPFLPVLGPTFGGVLGEGVAQLAEDKLDPYRLGEAAAVPTAFRIGRGGLSALSGILRKTFSKPLPVRGPGGQMEAYEPGLAAPATRERNALSALGTLKDIDIRRILERVLLGSGGATIAQQFGATNADPVLIGGALGGMEVAGPLMKTLYNLYNVAPKDPLAEALASSLVRGR